MAAGASYAARSRASQHAELRTELLDAAYAAIVAGTLSTTSMAAVAARVGVSRQTLYNEFGSRDRLVEALVARENAAILAEVTDTLLHYAGDLSAGVAAAVERVLTRAADDPLTKALLGGDPRLLPVFTTHAEPLLQHARAALTDYALTHIPSLDPEDAAVLVDAVVRLAHSHVVSPREPPDQVARRLSRLVDRFLGGVTDPVRRPGGRS